MIMHFRNNKDTGVRGLRPWLYRESPSAGMNREAYKKEYTLYTDDWFESGTRFSYSLHATEESARKFEFGCCWYSGNKIARVYVSPKTLEIIAKQRDGRRGGRGVFVSLER
jgi:hypothetical protein